MTVSEFEVPEGLVDSDHEIEFETELHTAPNAPGCVSDGLLSGGRRLDGPGRLMGVELQKRFLQSRYKESPISELARD